MRKILLYLTLLAFTCTLYAQKAANDNLDRDKFESFKGGVYEKINAPEGTMIRAYRFIGADGNPISNYVGILRPGEPIPTPEEAIRSFALYPGNTAVRLVELEIELDKLDGYIGICDGGRYVANPDGSYKLLPNWLLADPKHPYHQESANADVVHIRQGGRPQIVFSDSRDNLNKYIHVVKEWPLTDPDDTPPTPGGSAARIRANAEVNTDVQHIREVKKQNGDFPGGILLNDAVCTIKGLNAVRSVRYDAEKTAFIINEEYTYRSYLMPEELAELSRVANNFDRRLGMLSQDEGINLNPKGSLMRTLSSADAALGPIAYGYDMQGNQLFNAPEGYESAFEQETDEARWWLFNWDAVMRKGATLLEGWEPRLFLEFKQFTFRPDLRDHSLNPDQMDLNINYQAFKTDLGGRETYANAALDKLEPHISRAIDHLKSHYTEYESRNTDLLRARHIAAAFAFLKYLADHQIPVANASAYMHAVALEVPYAYDKYADMAPDSDMARWARKALSALEWVPTLFISEESELKLTWLMLQYACMAQDAEKIAEYRKKAAGLLHNLDEGSPYAPLRMKLSASLEYMNANGMAGKTAFARKYETSHPAMSANYYRAALEYYKKAVEIEPDLHTHYSELAYLYEKTGDKTASKAAAQKALELSIKAADEGSATAQYNAALMLLDPEQGPVKLSSAETYLRSAASQGYPVAALQLGYLLGFTPGRVEDLESAFSFFNMAAEAGLPEAQYCLACCYNNGLGVKTHREQALEWFRESAEANYSRSQLAYGELLLQKGQRAAARIWIKRAADQGLKEAQKSLAHI